jgi:hypothetical protein
MSPTERSKRKMQEGQRQLLDHKVAIERGQPSRAKRALLWFWQKPIRSLASAIVALIVAILLIFRDTVLSQFLPKEAIGDRVREIRGDPAIQITRVDTLNEHKRFARADVYQFTPLEQKQLQDITNPTVTPILNQVQHGGLPVGISTWRIYLHGGRNQTMQVLDIHPINIKRGRPLAGTLFDITPQGGGNIPQIGMNMDSPDPEARMVKPDGETLGMLYFRNKTLSLSDREGPAHCVHRLE